jgi:hypothetical protein
LNIEPSPRHDFLIKIYSNKPFMEPIEKKTTSTDSRSSQDPRERLQQNPASSSDELKENTSKGDKNDLLNEDPDEERREIEESSEEALESAE